MNELVLQFVEVSYRYPGNAQATLDRLNLELPLAKVTAILGPNGAGKSTLLRLAYGRFRPSFGRILLAGRPLNSYSRSGIGKRIALVPQREYTPFEYSILEYVLLGRAPHLSPLELPGAEDCRIAENALALVGMEDQSGRSLLSLSGGELQLVLIARALAQQPRLLLLDEPTSHLDLANKKRLVDCLKGLALQGVTVLMTSHEPEVVSAIAEQVVLMNHGHVLFAGTQEEVWTEQRMSATYGIPLKVEELAGRRFVLWD